MKTPAAGRLLRLLVAFGLTAILLWKSDPRAVLAAAAGADWRLIGCAVVLVFFDRALMAYRWLMLLCTVDRARRPSLAATMRVFFVSTFVGTFLPASVGGDAVRAYSIAKLDVDAGDAVASVLMDRMLGVASILVMALVGLLLARDLAGNVAILFSLAVTAAVCGAALLLIFSVRAATLATKAVALAPWPAVRQGAGRVLQSIRGYAVYHRQLANVLVCSIGVQALRILQAYYLGRSLGIDVPLSGYFAFVPLILLIMLLPLTINGIGTSQAAFVWFFARANVPAASAFALSVLFVALGIVGNLPGGLLYAVGRTQRTADPVRTGDVRL